MPTCLRRGYPLALLAAATLVACRADAPRPAAPRPVAPTSPEPVWIDVRDPAEFDAGHLPGAISLQLGWGQLNLRLVDLVAPGPVNLAGADARQLTRAASIVAAAGYTVVERQVIGPETAGLVALPEWTTASLQTALRGTDPPLVIDARTVKEYGKGHIRGAVYIYPNDVQPLLACLDRTRQYVIICEEGWRSATVGSLMLRQGFSRVANAIEGMKGWRAAGLPQQVASDEASFQLVP